ncbi:SusD/RagB family nutrient-binding outer membrane lipoprotein [uncultured Polaribacter sp.]|uniref:SusD/RagB family nutrient-binding outer membrane lipoprotein n=1 Tax=uncultured Polaribacter sp. TaxID=174711 RepID=UPI0030D75385|tara:strand:- start:6353 stop:7771 length:1419 start_codon:yes stop_codon:yes gene_type:complete
MKKTIKKILLFTAATLFMYSCDTVDFGDINTDPNNPSTASASGLLANALKSLPGHLTQTTSILYAQYTANGQYPDESRYGTLNWSYYGWYSGPLEDLRVVVETNVETPLPNSDNVIAAATLIRAYYLHTMTDRWGMIPYTEALQGLENTKPVLDTQETVYKGLFDEIDSALSMIDNTQDGPEGDILFNGDMARWKQFGNTLKTIMALRLSKRDTELGGYAKTKFNEAIGGAIKTSSDNIYYTFLSDDNNDNPWQDRYVDDGRTDWLVSDVLVDYLVGTGTDTDPQDPRLHKYADPLVGSNQYVGADYGVGNDLIANYSLPTTDIIYNQTAPAYIFTAAQIQFSMAEAVELGWMSGSAETYFEAGIQESMNQWGVDAADATTFISSISYTGIQSIAEQKWVALYLQGYEAWAEWRRIGGPSTIVKPADQLIGTDIPQRQAYSSTTPNINEANYNAAIAAQGPDTLDTVLWVFK